MCYQSGISACTTVGCLQVALSDKVFRVLWSSSKPKPKLLVKNLSEIQYIPFTWHLSTRTLFASMVPDFGIATTNQLSPKSLWFSFRNSFKVYLPPGRFQVFSRLLSQFLCQIICPHQINCIVINTLTSNLFPYLINYVFCFSLIKKKGTLLQALSRPVAKCPFF